MSSGDASKPIAGKYVPPALRKRMEEDSSRAPEREEAPRRERWAEEPRGDSRGFYSKPQQSNYPSSSNRSQTGTGWDVRDGRRYYPERESDLFRRSEEIRSGINFESYDNIPVEFTGANKDKIKPVDNFKDVDCHELLLENVKRMLYEKPTPVQRYSIPTILDGRDLMACAQTGSGKTAAFLFPVIAGLLRIDPPESVSRKICPAALVFAPTRELAQQIFDEARKWCFGTGIRACALYGGTEIRTQRMDCQRGCDICVATPGRLNDYIDRRYISLSQVKYVVFDEADRMLDMGFEPQIRKLVDEEDLPSKKNRQTVMFSATFPTSIQRLASDFLHDYMYLTVGRVGSTHEFITQSLIYAEEGDKFSLLIRELDKQEEDDLVLVFVETKRKADDLEDFLNRERFYATSIHGDRTQEEREEALRHFKTGRCPILVATDVAARGLNIPHVKLVINFDLPSNVDDYVHRIGRTGRAGNTGKATAFVNGNNRGILRDLQVLLQEASQEVPSWLTDLVRSNAYAFSKGGGRGGRGGRGGGGRSFGGRDHRDGQSWGNEGGNEGARGGDREQSRGGRSGGDRDDWGGGFNKSSGGRDSWD